MQNTGTELTEKQKETLKRNHGIAVDANTTATINDDGIVMVSRDIAYSHYVTAFLCTSDGDWAVFSKTPKDGLEGIWRGHGKKLREAWVHCCRRAGIRP